MSQAPCTLFCPRKGLTPVDGLPTWPVSMARFAQVFTLSVPVVCWVMPMAYRSMALAVPAYSRAARMRSRASTPLICSTTLGVYLLTVFLSSSKPSVRDSTYSRSKSSSSIMTCIRPLSTATSVPMPCLRWMRAYRASGISRGSMRISPAPCSTALMTRDPMSGCCSVVLEPTTRKRSASSISGMELVMAPEPKAAARPATVELCQSLAQ